MSFSQNIENNPKSSELVHLPKNLTTEIHKHDANGFKSSQNIVLPPTNRFGGQIRSKPQSGFNQATLISSNGQLDYHLNSAGYVEKLYLEMELTISTAAATIIPQYLIDRVELLSSEGNIISTIYGDCIYFQKIHKTLEQHNRERLVENLGSNYDGLNIPVGQKRIIFHIPTFLDSSALKLSVIKSKLIARIYFSSLGVTVGSAANVTVSLCDIIQQGIQLSPHLEQLENHRKMNGIHHFRFLNMVRVASQTISMVASNYYDIRLTSANSLSAFLIFVIRANPITNANINTYIQLDSYELLDKDNVIVGIKTTHEYDKLNSLAFQGDILNYKNIYLVPFAISIESANQGNQVGFYSMTSNEILRVYMRSDLASGSYRVDVYSADINRLTLNNGNLLVSK